MKHILKLNRAKENHEINVDAIWQNNEHDVHL